VSVAIMVTETRAEVIMVAKEIINFKKRKQSAKIAKKDGFFCF
jgi:hypothetical protein